MSIITKNKTLLQEMQEVLRRQGYAYATEKSYCDWVSQFIKFHQLKNKKSLFDGSEKKIAQILVLMDGTVKQEAPTHCCNIF